MQGAEVFAVLKKLGATHLHHANSVTTSCTFLEQAGLLSRGFVEDHGLKQTAQPLSDDIDKKYAVWHSIFVDHVDVHGRASRKNHYGPVLFFLDLDILLGLPDGTDVLVTKQNPTHWNDQEADGDRFFQSSEELSTNIRFGNFDKMVVIQTPSGRLDFPNRRARILLDDPKRHLSSSEDGYTYAENRLIAAAAIGHVEATVKRRACNGNCTCVERYAAYGAKQFEFFFT
jgi:hypothetical protein